MISITVPVSEVYDQRKNVFYRVEKPVTLQLEHSLISVQKWEAKWEKCFLNTRRKTQEEAIDYVRCMCITPNVNEDVFYCIPGNEMNRIAAYIEAPMTALKFTNDGTGTARRKKEIVTADIIYYWMISYGIPSEYRKWHFNQLMTLIQVFNEKNQDPKKRKRKSRMQLLNEFKDINEANKKLFGTKG